VSKRSDRVPSHATSRLLDDLRRIVQALRESSRTAQQTLGVSGAQLFVLKALSGSEPLSLNQLATRTRTHQSTVSVVVKRLVEHRLVARAISSQDGRQVELLPTAAGRALLRRAPGAAQERILEGLEKLSAAECEALANALRGLVIAMGLGDQRPQMFFEETAPAEKRRGRGKPPSAVARG
jgi:DNA-binding MarR family transcriptional regulator